MDSTVAYRRRGSRGRGRDPRGASPRVTSSPRAAPCCAGSAAGAATRRCSSGTTPPRRARGQGPAPGSRDGPDRPGDLAPRGRRCSSGSATRSSCAASAPWLEGRFPHLVLEHLDGPTLDELLARGGPLALEQFLPLGLHVASALHYLAGEGIVHLDVKPSNIVMGGPPRLIDLAVARTLAEAARAARPDRHRRLHGPRAVRARRPPRPARRRLRPRRHALHRPHRHAPVPACEPLAAADRVAGPLPRRTPPALADVLLAGLDPDPAARPTAARLRHRAGAARRGACRAA